jgi:Mor family transcriptional regulator
MMDQPTDRRGLQILYDIADTLATGLASSGVAKNQARELARQAADMVRHTYGGEQLYIPKGHALTLCERDREIWRKFNGSNTLILAKDYDLTARQIYSIVARVREEEFHQRQGKLFE